MNKEKIKQEIKTIRKMMEHALKSRDAIEARNCIKKLKKLDKMLYDE